MATYTQSDNSIIGSTYFQGIIMPWDEYILIPVSDTKSVLIVGSYENTDGDQITFKNTKVYSLDRGSNYGYTYTTSLSEEDLTTVIVSEPYYTYSNSYPGSPVLNCTSATSVMAYFVCFAVLLTVINQIAGNLIKSLFKENNYD